jgi:hypothetical protein
MDFFRQDHPIRDVFAEALRTSLDRHVGFADEQVETYLIDLMVEFMHRDRLFSLRNAEGRRIETVSEMIAEGDVRLNAESFDREREVHKHLGDYLLFCGGMFPEMLERQAVDVDGQGRESYYIASTFSHSPYEAEAALFARLSAEFPAYRFGLKMVRDTLRG